MQDEICMGPLAADAIKVFGGRSWTISGMSKVFTYIVYKYNLRCMIYDIRYFDKLYLNLYNLRSRTREGRSPTRAG